MSDENRIRLIASQPIRGRILDRNGNVLADSRVKYSLIIKPQSVNDINWEKIKDKALVIMLKRYIEEANQGDFAVYMGNETTGLTQTLK